MLSFWRAPSLHRHTNWLPPSLSPPPLSQSPDNSLCVCVCVSVGLLGVILGSKVAVDSFSAHREEDEGDGEDDDTDLVIINISSMGRWGHERDAFTYPPASYLFMCVCASPVQLV